MSNIIEGLLNSIRISRNSGYASNIPKFLNSTSKTNVPMQNVFVILASFICLTSLQYKSPELSFIGLALMLEAFISLDYGQFNTSNLMPLYMMIPKIISSYGKSHPYNLTEKIIVDTVEK